MTTASPRHSDQSTGLQSVAARLAHEFAGTFGTETVEHLLQASYDKLAAPATVTTFLPLLAERFTRQRLQALAKVEGRAHGAAPVVLFLCTHNAGRSQMAMGFFQRYAGDTAVAWSGGSIPGWEVNPSAVAAMAELGINIADEYPKPWTDEVLQAADVVITMGCGDACPLIPGKRYLDWELPDPAGLPVEQVRPIRDEIERKVMQLISELGLRPHD